MSLQSSSILLLCILAAVSIGAAIIQLYMPEEEAPAFEKKRASSAESTIDQLSQAVDRERIRKREDSSLRNVPTLTDFAEAPSLADMEPPPSGFDEVLDIPSSAELPRPEAHPVSYVRNDDRQEDRHERDSHGVNDFALPEGFALAEFSHRD